MNTQNTHHNIGFANTLKTTLSCYKTLIAIGFGLLAPLTAGAQSTTNVQKVPAPASNTFTKETVLLPQAIIPKLKVEKRAPLHKAQPLPQMMTLPDGSRVPLSQLKRQFAKQEADLNKEGLSLFDTTKPSLVLSPDLDNNLLEQQKQQLINQGAKANARRQQEGRTIETSSGGFDRIYPWSWTVGNHSYFQVGLNTYLRVAGNRSFLYAEAEGNVNGAILGNDFSVASADVSAFSYGGNVTGSFQFQVLGNYVMNWSTTKSATWTWNWSWQKEVAEPYHIQLGPVPIGGRVGIRGGIGCDLNLGLYGSWAGGRITPYVYTAGFAEVGVDIYFAGAGVGGQLTFLNCSMPIEGGAYLQSPNGRLQMVTYGKTSLNVSTLSGNFYIWAQLFGSYSYWNLWSWNGINWNGWLWYDVHTINL